MKYRTGPLYLLPTEGHDQAAGLRATALVRGCFQSFSVLAALMLPKQMVAPVRIILELLIGAIDRAAALFIPREDADSGEKRAEILEAMTVEVFYFCNGAPGWLLIGAS
jgi:hypothetical protein